MHRLRTLLLMTALVGFSVFLRPESGSAETILQALASAYSNNPEINSARANTRAVDENVPIAKAGLRPILSLFNNTTGARRSAENLFDVETIWSNAVGVQLEQNIFRGFRVKNAILQSEAGVLASRELLRNTVQNVLFDAAQAYMDVLQNIAILDIRRRNVLFLQEQVRASNERFNVGETTRTDVAQTRARLAVAQADVSLAGANLATSRALYHQIVGHDATRLTSEFPFRRLIPKQLSQAISLGQDNHPVIMASIHQADAQSFLVKQIEGERLPSASLAATLQRSDNITFETNQNSATIAGRLSIPLYQGGATSARIRQAKEQYGLRKIEIDLARDQVRAAVVTAWAQAEAASGAIAAANEGISAADIALSGVQEEQRVGQRTTLDVLNAQQELLNARETLVIAQRNQLVSWFSLISAMGRLTAEPLRLPVDVYDPVDHYRMVEGKWNGSRTPDGR